MQRNSNEFQIQIMQIYILYSYIFKKLCFMIINMSCLDVD